MILLVENLLSHLKVYFDPEKIGSLLAEFLVKIILASIVLVAFYLIWWILRRIIFSALTRRLDKTSIAFIETLVKFSILGVALLVALSAAGVQTTAVLTSLGVVGLTIGFAARDTLSNIISGILIFLDRPFTIDDLVEIDGNYGRVDRITLRSVRIVTNDGKMLAVPNTEVMNKTVSSYTNFPHLRVDVAVTVAISEDIDHVRSLLVALVQNDPDYMADPLPTVVVTQLNDYNVALEVRAWLQDERQNVQKRFKLREQVFKTLVAAGVDMPFETIQLAPHMIDINISGQANNSEHEQ